MSKILQTSPTRLTFLSVLQDLKRLLLSLCVFIFFKPFRLFSWIFKARMQPALLSPELRIIKPQDGDDVRRIILSQWTRNKAEKYVIELPFRKVHVLPHEYLTDYGWKKDDEISSNIDLRERILGRWTLLGSMTPMKPGDRTHSAVSFIKDYMTKNMATYFDAIHEEIESALEANIGTTSIWREISAYQLGIEINLAVFERVFVGLDLCRNEQWRAACKGYSSSAIQTAATLMGYAAWKRPFIAPFVKEYKVLKKHIAKIHIHLDNLLNNRLSHGKAKLPDGRETPKDFIDWWLEKAPNNKRHDSYALTLGMIQLNIAGIQSTGMVLMQALFDLASRPEYTNALLSELSQTTRLTGTTTMTPSSISKLVKLDSFLKESQRQVSQNLLSIYRKTITPLKLQDGTTLPANSYVAVPSINLETMPGSDNPNFDGFRWEKMRLQAENEQKFTTVASGIDTLEFGYGVHACPGRFFAMNTVKATLAQILTQYEMRMPLDGTELRHNYNPILVLVPSREQTVEFRDRKE
jgi:cytochrome P450